MTPFMLICDGLVAAGCVIYCIVNKAFDYALFTGLLFGNIAAVINFYMMAYTAGKLTMRGERVKPRRMMGLGYGARIIILFVVYYLLLTLGVIRFIPAVIPLLYPGFYYKIKAMFNKSV